MKKLKFLLLLLLIFIFCMSIVACAMPTTPSNAQSDNISASVPNTSEPSAMAKVVPTTSSSQTSAETNPAEDNLTSGQIDLNAQKAICNYVYALKANNFTAILQNSISYTDLNACKNNSSLLIKLKLVAEAQMCAKQTASLIFNILGQDKNVVIKDADIQKIKSSLDPNNLKDIQIVKLYSLKDPPKPAVANDYFMAALCKLHDKYFSIGFELNNTKAYGATIVQILGVNKTQPKTYTNAEDDFKTYIGTSIQDCEFALDQSKPVSTQIPAAPNFDQINFTDYMSSYYDIKPAYYKTPEDCIKAYLNALKNNDISGILKISSSMPIAEKFSLSRVINLLGTYVPNIDSGLPEGSDFYTQLKQSYTLGVFADKSALAGLIILTDVSDLNGKTNLLSLMQSKNPADLKGIKLQEIFEPGVKSNISAGYEQLCAQMAQTDGAQEECYRIALFTYGSDYCAAAFTLQKVNDSWLIQGFNPNILNTNAYVVVTKLKSASDFDQFR